MPDINQHLNEDLVVACADLVGRAGAEKFELGYLHDDVPVDQADWYASAYYRGARISADGHQSPTLAAVALAQRLLAGATCRCGQTVALSDDGEGCRWRLNGRRWEPSCDVPPVRIHGVRGDHAAMQRALAEHQTNGGRRA